MSTLDDGPVAIDTMGAPLGGDAEPREDPAPVLRAVDMARWVSRWGFLAAPDLPDGPGPAFLLVALRPVPTLSHYDPEAIDYWVTEGGRGARRSLTHDSPMPLSEDYSWGPIRLIDRLGASNEYLTFGGHLDAAAIDDGIVAALASPAPLLRRGGHSQDWDLGADAIGAFFGRLMVAVDFTPGFEATLAQATPLTRYAAFVRDGLARRAAGVAFRPDDDLRRLLANESARLRAAARSDWDAAEVVLHAAFDK